MKFTKTCLFIVLFAVIIIYSGFSTTVEINFSATWGLYDEIVNEAYKYLGVPYVSAGISKDGVDCSGLTYSVYKEVTGLVLPRSVADLILQGEVIENNLLPGDLVFFDTVGGPSHVGIYIGGGEFIHAASDGPRTGVTIDNLSTDYYKDRYLGARRHIENNFPLIKIVIDDESGTLVIPYTLPSGIPLYFSIASEMSDDVFVELKMLKGNDTAVFTKRIRLYPDEEPALIMFIPDAGSWKAVISNSKEMVWIDFLSEDSE